MLKISKLNAGYGSFQALFNIDIEVNTGEAVAVIGPNGAGKSTLMKLIANRSLPSDAKSSIHMVSQEFQANQ